MTAAEYLDVRDFSKRTEDDIELMIELYQLFIENSKIIIGEINESVERNDAATLKKSAHTLKGSSASISAMGIQEIASELEIIAIANDLSKAILTAEKLRHSFEMTILEIQSVIVNLSSKLPAPKQAR